MSIVESQVMPASIYPMELLAEMYQLESADQKAARLKRLAEYDASKHINEWEKFDKLQNQKVTIRYYPAAWRLFELHLRYPYANFSSEIYLCDRESDIVVVKCHLYLGPSYELSPKKAEAYKQGRLSMLDKIETAAKARCARDFGIGTEHALDIEDAEIGDYTPGEEPRATNNKPSASRQPATTNQRPATANNTPRPAPAANNRPATNQPATAAPAGDQQPTAKAALLKKIDELQPANPKTGKKMNHAEVFAYVFSAQIQQRKVTVQQLVKCAELTEEQQLLLQAFIDLVTTQRAAATEKQKPAA